MYRLTAEQQAIVDKAREVVDRDIAPNARRVDAEGGIPSRKISEINDLANFGRQDPGNNALWGKIHSPKELAPCCQLCGTVIPGDIIAAIIDYL